MSGLLNLILLITAVFCSVHAVRAQPYYMKSSNGVPVYTNIKPEDNSYKKIRSPWGSTKKQKKINYGSNNYSRDYDRLIANAGDIYNVDPNLIKAIIKVESGFNPKAVSRKGAMGLMQLMPQTALKNGVVNPFDPADNIYGGVKYFRMLLNMFNGNLKLALAGYNAGENAVIDHGFSIPPYPETQNYVKKTLYHYSKISRKKVYHKTNNSMHVKRVKYSGEKSPVYSEKDLVSELSGKFLVQLASYPQLSLARELEHILKSKGYPAFIQKAYLPKRGTWYRVRIGSFSTKEEAKFFGDSISSKEPDIDKVIVVNL